MANAAGGPSPADGPRPVRRPQRPQRALIGWIGAAVAVVIVALIAVAHHGTPDTGRTALAITKAGWRGQDAPFEIHVECARILSVTVGRDHGGSSLPEVTVWGVPRMGRCTSAVHVRLPGRTLAIVDGTTSQVVHLTPL